MPTLKYHLVHWLRDAYAMELQSIDMLERQITRAGHDPSLEKRLIFHLEETRSQVEKLRDCLKHLGSHTNDIKIGLGRLVGNMHAISITLGPEDLVKGSIISSIFERFEIGCYEALVVAATESGEHDIADVCRSILTQECQMEDWLEHHLPDVTRHYLHQSNHNLYNQHGQAI